MITFVNPEATLNIAKISVDTTNTNKKVLIYSQDGLGLGHLRRNVSITSQIKKICPDATVLIVADSPMAPFFELPPKCDFIKIPTIVKVDYGVWKSNRLNLDSNALIPVRAEMIQSIAIGFQPDIFLVDHMPQGALGELTLPIQNIKRYSQHTRMVLGLRDILGAPGDIHKQWTKENAYELTENFYDQVLIYGCQNIFDSVSAYQFSRPVAKKTHFCGYVTRGDVDQEFSNRSVKRYLPEREEKLVLVTGGGGHDASSFMDMFLDAIRKLQDQLPFIAIVSTGPFMHPDQMAILQEKARGLPVTVATLGGDVIHFLKRADLIISMAGYNTFGEILHFRKNAIIIPRPGPSAEQTMRTDLFAKWNLFHTIHPDNLNVEVLSDAIKERLEHGSLVKGDNLPDMNGAYNAARKMLTTVN